MGEVHRFRPRGRRPTNEYQRRKMQRGRKSTPHSPASTIGGIVILGVLIGIPIAAEFGPPLVGCNVKGNISYDTGKRIYHVLGQEYYSETRISWLKGERWFCSEEAARAAGWRRAFR